jgi:hypothetical protein
MATSTVMARRLPVDLLARGGAASGCEVAVCSTSPADDVCFSMAFQGKTQGRWWEVSMAHDIHGGHSAMALATGALGLMQKAERAEPKLKLSTEAHTKYTHIEQSTTHKTRTHTRTQHAIEPHASPSPACSPPLSPWPSCRPTPSSARWRSST